MQATLRATGSAHSSSLRFPQFCTCSIEKVGGLGLDCREEMAGFVGLGCQFELSLFVVSSPVVLLVYLATKWENF